MTKSLYNFFSPTTVSVKDTSSPLNMSFTYALWWYNFIVQKLEVAGLVLDGTEFP